MPPWSSAPSDVGNGLVGMLRTTAACSAEPQAHRNAWRKSLDLQGRAQAEGPWEEHGAGEREINPQGSRERQDPELLFPPISPG